jgi:hypothetical protein
MIAQSWKRPTSDPWSKAIVISNNRTGSIRGHGTHLYDLDPCPVNTRWYVVLALAGHHTCLTANAPAKIYNHHPVMRLLGLVRKGLVIDALTVQIEDDRYP